MCCDTGTNSSNALTPVCSKSSRYRELPEQHGVGLDTHHMPIEDQQIPVPLPLSLIPMDEDRNSRFASGGIEVCVHMVLPSMHNAWFQCT